MLVKLVNPWFFYTPDSHLTRLNTIYTDNLIRHRFWLEFITALNFEWQELASSHFVLNANVSFLSIQSVDQGGSHRSPAQIASYLSIVASVDAYRDRDTPEKAADFMLQKLAILYSLPYATFMWSMISFSVALSFACFQKSSLVTRTLIGVFWIAAVCVFVAWCIFTFWEASDWGWMKRWFNVKNRCEAEVEVEADASPVGEAPSLQPIRQRWQVPFVRGRSLSTGLDETVV
ncbi:hypothetical protein B0H12DRAFT_1098823 [Mycena haematopus]|nr:hypothetical protein B0H12DRAFT_1098823 [Mycena haematopus]